MIKNIPHLFLKNTYAKFYNKDQHISADAGMQTVTKGRTQRMRQSEIGRSRFMAPLFIYRDTSRPNHFTHKHIHACRPSHQCADSNFFQQMHIF